jgi:hypothetical protein
MKEIKMVSLELLDFPDTIRDAAKYDELGFEVKIDDPANNIWSASFDASGKTDVIGILTLLEDCKEAGLEPGVYINSEPYNFEDGLKAVDKIAADDSYCVWTEQ